ncbi:MAG: hypothetical protein NZL98_05505, partial [Anaerolineales bacterium]|nr:hypothetical protein [Anaerolineales bacterium]MDW8227175.1 hypothetical protein [Anaerolineales bacterium]
MKLRLSASFLLLVLMLTLTVSVRAQTYRFSLDAETVHVFWNSDGTVAIDYVFVFTNSPNADPIDFVDVGMPHNYFDRNSISADVNGVPVSISEEYYGSGYGFAVDLGAQAIPPGRTGSVHVFVGRVTHMLYPSTEYPDTHVSGQFSPTWFGAEYVTGSTNMTVVFHLPPGVQPDEAIYYPVKGDWPCETTPTAGYDQEQRITYSWACPQANGYTQYTFGLSFPKQYIPEETIITSPPPFQPAESSFDLESLLGLAFCCCFIGMFVGLPIVSIVNERKRKLQYLPPKISIEGHGIKRGLTAVEAAILMEQPLDKVMTMILFGVVKKGAATVISRDPLKLEAASPLPENLHEYERNFLAAFAAP